MSGLTIPAGRLAPDGPCTSVDGKPDACSDGASNDGAGGGRADDERASNDGAADH